MAYNDFMAQASTVSEKKTLKLEKEVGLLRSFLIGQAGKDKEGVYNPAFARRVLKLAEQTPRYKFENADSFLRHIKGR